MKREALQRSENRSAAAEDRPSTLQDQDQDQDQDQQIPKRGESLKADVERSIASIPKLSGIEQQASVLLQAAGEYKAANILNQI